jgi:hypothetical protein
MQSSSKRARDYKTGMSSIVSVVRVATYSNVRNRAESLTLGALVLILKPLISFIQVYRQWIVLGLTNMGLHKLLPSLAPRRLLTQTIAERLEFG